MDAIKRWRGVGERPAYAGWFFTENQCSIPGLFVTRVCELSVACFEIGSGGGRSGPFLECLVLVKKGWGQRDEVGFIRWCSESWWGHLAERRTRCGGFGPGHWVATLISLVRHASARPTSSGSGWRWKKRGGPHRRVAHDGE